MKSLSTSTRFMKLSSKNTVRLVALPLFVLPLFVLPVLVHVDGAEAKPVTRSSVALTPVNEAWPGKRVLMVLPLRTSEAWQGNPEFTRAFLPLAQTALRDALSRTGKFSLLEVRRFNPVLMRAVQDGVATSDDLNSLLAQPTVPNASVFLAKTTFNVAPQQSYSVPATIGSFVLESVEQMETGLRMKVTGRMYEPGATTAMRALSATVTVPTALGLSSARTPAVTAATAGFDRILNEFTRYPTERELPIVPVTPVATVVAPVTTETTTVTTTSDVVLPGTPIAGASGRPLTPDGRASAPTTTTTMSATTTTVTPAAGLLTAGGITIEVETPPAEKFPVAPAPVDNGGGEGIEAVEEDDTSAGVDSNEAVVDEGTSGESVGEANNVTTDDSGTPDAGTGEEAVDEGGAEFSDTSAGVGNPSSPIVEISDDAIAPEDVLSGEVVTTSIRSRVRERIPGEQPAFER